MTHPPRPRGLTPYRRSGAPTIVEFLARIESIGREHDELARRDGLELCDDELERDVDDDGGAT